MATTQTDSFGMSPEFIAAQQAKANAANTITATAPIETVNIWGIAPTPNAPIDQVASPQPIASPTPTDVAETPAVVPTDSFGMSQDFIKQQQEKFKAPVVEPVKVETKVETPKVESPKVDTNVSAGREKEIMANLTDGAKNAPQLFKDRASFDAAYWYSTADAGKKAILDSFFMSRQAPQDENTLFAQIVGGQTQWMDSKSTAYTAAKKRADNYSRFSNYSADQFSSAFKNGDILEGSQTWKDLQSNPQAKANLQKAKMLNQINWEKTNVPNAATTIMKDVVETTGIGAAFADWIITADEMNKMTNSPAIEAKTKETEILKNKVDEYDNELEDIENQVDKELEGTWATASKKYALVAERSKAITKMRNNAADTYNNAVATLWTMKTDAAKLLDVNLGLFREQSAFDRQKALADYQAKLGLQTKQAEFEQGLKQQEQLANDPYTAIKSIMDKYEKEWITFDQDATKKLADFRASGKTLQEYTTRMISDIKSKPEYKKSMELKMGQLSDTDKLKLAQQFDIDKMKMSQNFELARDAAKNIKDTKWTKLDDGMYQDANGNIATADDLKNAKLFGNTYLSANAWDTGGECGFYASRATGLGSTPGGNSKEARLSAFSDTKPEIGGMAFFGWPWYDKTYGHISIVTGVDEANGTIDLKESNYNGDKKVTKRTVPMSTVTGYYNNTPLAKWVGWTGGEKKYTDSEIELYAELANMDASARNTALKAQGIPLKDVTDYMAAAKAGTVPTTAAQKDSANNIMSEVEKLVKMNDYQDATGTSTLFPTIPGSDAASAEAAIDNIVAKLTMSNLGLLKWPMSDKDIEFLKATASKLQKNISDEQFDKNLVELYNISARKSGKPEVKTIADIQNRETNPQTEEFDKLLWTGTFAPQTTTNVVSNLLSDY